MILHQQLGAKPYGTGCHSVQSNDAICCKYNIGKYNIFQRPNKAMLFVMVKACLSLENILFS